MREDEFREVNDAPHGDWFRGLFASMKEGGVWGIPRSGVFFRKEGDGLVVHELLPWHEGMEHAQAYHDFAQGWEIMQCTRHFKAIGVTVSNGN